MVEIKTVSPAELAVQGEYIQRVKLLLSQVKTSQPLAMIHTYGCQQNVSDSEHIKGMFEQMGYGFTDDPACADLILFNTCAVREHAEDRVFGNVGALKAHKRRNPNLIIALCGCMVQQEHISEKLYHSYPFVDIIFGTHVIHRLPELLWGRMNGGKRVRETPVCDGVIAEGLPVHRDSTFKGWLPIMYGCNNFCTYCIVPYVRGRERSRDPEEIVAEAREMVAAGYKEITLLGQNVNSYGRGAAHGVNFPELLRRINAIEGDFVIRFMTSHPKDATNELFDTIAACKKVSRHFHLPFQSGSNRILKEMNRGYTREQYLDRVRYARSVVPDIAFTSDVIVGFPGETREDFEQTLSLIKEVEFVSLFTFIFSPRRGTPAEKMNDPTPAETKTAWFKEMTDLQEEIASKRQAKQVGKRYRALIESAKDGYLEARLQDNTVVRVNGGEERIGQFADVVITSARSWICVGDIVD